MSLQRRLFRPAFEAVSFHQKIVFATGVSQLRKRYFPCHCDEKQMTAFFHPVLITSSSKKISDPGQPFIFKVHLSFYKHPQSLFLWIYHN